MKTLLNIYVIHTSLSILDATLFYRQSDVIPVNLLVLHNIVMAMIFWQYFLCREIVLHEWERPLHYVKLVFLYTDNICWIVDWVTVNNKRITILKFKITRLLSTEGNVIWIRLLLFFKICAFDSIQLCINCKWNLSYVHYYYYNVLYKMHQDKISYFHSFIIIINSYLYIQRSK